MTDEHDPPTLELDYTLCKIHSMGLLLTQAALDECVEPDLFCLADLGRVITDQADHGLEILFEVQAEIRAKKSEATSSLDQKSKLQPTEPVRYPSHENLNSRSLFVSYLFHLVFGFLIAISAILPYHARRFWKERLLCRSTGSSLRICGPWRS